MNLAGSAASALGMRDLPVVVVDHPVATLPREAVHALADRALPEVVRGLSRSADGS
jgi:hypothetical protein